MQGEYYLDIIMNKNVCAREGEFLYINMRRLSG